MMHDDAQFEQVLREILHLSMYVLDDEGFSVMTGVLREMDELHPLVDFLRRKRREFSYV